MSEWKIRFGTAGTSDSFTAMGYKNSLDIPAYTEKMGLDAFEYQCGHGVRLGLDKARQMADDAAARGILFSVHAPYYISASSLDEEKRLNSVNYLLQSAALCRALGGRRVIFHSGSCGRQSREAALEKALDTLRRAQAALTETAPIVADEDDAWVGGIFYYNPTDKRFLVAKRIGLGSTVNLGTWAGKLYYAFVGLVLVVCLAIGPIFGIVDSIPVRLELSGSAPVCLVASHGQSEKYRLDTDAITDVQLRDTLPDAARTWGTGMDHYLQGDFYVVGEGNARFCLDPTQKCFLRVEAGGQVYWFTGDSEDHTAAIAQALQSTVHP